MGAALAVALASLLWYTLFLVVIRRADVSPVARRAFLLYLLTLILWVPGTLVAWLLAPLPGYGLPLALLAGCAMPLGCYLYTRAFHAWTPPRSAHDALLGALVALGMAQHLAAQPDTAWAALQMLYGLSLLGLAAWLWVHTLQQEPRQGPRRRRIMLMGLTTILLTLVVGISPLRGRGLEIILAMISTAVAVLLMLRRRLPPLPMPQRRSTGFAALGLLGAMLCAILALGAHSTVTLTLLILAAGLHLAAITLTFPDVVGAFGLWVEHAILRAQFDARRMVEEMAEVAPSVLDLEPLTEMILERTLSVLDIRWGLFALWDRTTGELRTVATRGLEEAMHTLVWPHDHPLTRWLLEGATGVLLPDQLPPADYVQPSWLVPVRLRDEPVGLFLYGPHTTGLPLSATECSILSLLANETSAAVANARLFNQVARARREWLQTFDALSDGVFLHDRQGRILRANRALARLVNRPFEQIISHPWFEMIPASPAVQEVCRQQATASASDTAEYDLGYGPQRTLHVTVSPLLEGEGACVHVVRDVTEERSLQRQLAQAEKLAAIGQMLSGVAHELNNPLTTIIGFSELLQDAQVPERVRTDLERIYRQAKHSARIVQSLLAFARQSRIQLAEVDLNALLHQVIDFLQPQLQSHHIQVQMELDPDLPTTLADAGQLQQVLLNLCTNALQAMSNAHGGGTLFLSTGATPAHVRAIVRDDGPGIPPETLPRIFDPFFTTKAVGEGTGLGLSICYGIVREHGGRIWAESVAGEGATFYVELPLRHGSAAPAPTSPVAGGKGRQILVVEDDEAVLALIQRVLVPAGYTVRTASNGEEGLEALAQGPAPDLIIADLRMPRLDGPSFYARLQREYGHLARRLLFITGDTIAPSSAAFLQGTNLPCLSKPFGARELTAAVARQLAAVSNQ